MAFPAGPHKEARLFGNYVARTTVAFSELTTGAIGNHDIFTVSGAIHAVVVGYCTELLTGASATISVGTDGVVAGLIALTNAVDIDADEMWFDTGPSECEANSSIGGAWVCDNISYDVLTDTIDDGTVEFVCFWTPVSADATVVAA